MQAKADLRKELLRRRDHIPSEVRRAKNRLIQERLFSLDEVRNAVMIFFFASFRTEVDTTGSIRTSLSEGKRVIVPKVDMENHQLLLCEIQGLDELTPGYMGIPEPACQGMRMNISDMDIVIIPGAGFDVFGNRIGYGGGYYDRLLSGLQKKVPVIAPAYEEQVTDLLPSEPHDIRVDVIVTDRRLIRCGPPLQA